MKLDLDKVIIRIIRRKGRRAAEAYYRKIANCTWEEAKVVVTEIVEVYKEGLSDGEANG